VKPVWSVLLGAAVLGAVVAVAIARHTGPTRCDPGWISLGPRCCAPGQVLGSGHCQGDARVCPPGFHRAAHAPFECVREPHRVRIDRTRVNIGPNDWQSEQVPVLTGEVGPLWSDSIEVTNEQWRACAATNHCAAKSLGEAGQPVVHVTLEEAQDYCRANGGRLPNVQERMAIAVGAESRRYPWGQTGLVCRRAVFGLSDGPCAEKGTQPEVTGSHAAGQSPQGVFDLSGNVAELAVDSRGRAWVCGGSFRSHSALELMTLGSDACTKVRARQKNLPCLPRKKRKRKTSGRLLSQRALRARDAGARTGRRRAPERKGTMKAKPS